MNLFLATLMILALAASQVCAGGVRPAFCLPCYLLLVVAALWTIRLPCRRTVVIPPGACLSITFALSGYLLARALLSPVPYLARADILVTLACLAVYLLAALYLSPGDRVLVLTALLALAVANCGVEMIQWKDEAFMPLSLVARDQHQRRSSGFYGNPNHLAACLEVLLMMGLSLTCWTRRKRWTRLLPGFASCAAFAGILLTASRGGFLATVAGLAVFGTLSWLTATRRSTAEARHAGAAAALAGLAMIVTTGLIFHYHPRLAERVSELKVGNDSRRTLLSAAIRQFQLSPLFGTGSGTYLYYGRKFHDPAMQMDPIHVHNEYLELLAEYGITGLLAFLSFLGAHISAGFRPLWSFAKADRDAPAPAADDLALRIGALSAICACMVHSVFDFNLHIPANALLMAFIIGLTATAGARCPASPAFLGNPVPFALPALGLFFALFAVPRLIGDFHCYRAEGAVSRGDWIGAAASAGQGLSIDPANPDLYYQIGLVDDHEASIARQGSPDWRQDLLEAIDMYRRSSRLFPQNTRPMVRMAYALDQLTRFSDADALYRSALEWEPDYSYLLAYYGLHFLTMGNLPLARQYYLDARKLQDTHVIDEALDQIAQRMANPPASNAP